MIADLEEKQIREYLTLLPGEGELDS